MLCTLLCVVECCPCWVVREGTLAPANASPTSFPPLPSHPLPTPSHPAVPQGQERDGIHGRQAQQDGARSGGAAGKRFVHRVCGPNALAMQLLLSLNAGPVQFNGHCCPDHLPT